MSEANQNLNSFDAQFDSELVETIEITVHQVDNEVNRGNNKFDFKEVETPDEFETYYPKQNINWHKTAHKLREHNRKLIKQVFQLEQEQADLEDRLQLQLEKSYSSDTAIAQQAEQIENGLERISLLSEQLEMARCKAEDDRDALEHLAQQLEMSQRQAARLERECALLQESHNEKTFQLSNKDKQIQELTARLQQNPNVLQSSSLNKYDRQSAALKGTPSKMPQLKQPIQVWSVAVTQDKLPLSATASSTSNQKATNKTSEWIAPAIAKSQSTKKVKSLAAVELPKFPRQS